MRKAAWIIYVAVGALIEASRAVPGSPRHEWSAPVPGVRTCLRCHQSVGSPPPARLLPCDEAVCQAVLDV